MSELERKIDALANELEEVKQAVLSIKGISDYWLQKKAEEEREERRTR